MTGYLVRINGSDLPNLKSYAVQRTKLYSSAERNGQGNLKTTFLGIFPKIMLEFAPMNEADMSTLITLLDNDSFTVSWYDEKTNNYKSGTFYAGDFDYSLIKKTKGATPALYNEFSVNLISFNKMT